MKTPEQLALSAAIRDSGLAEARLAGMKIRAGSATAAPARFPYFEHWTCAEWEEIDGVIVEREMSLGDRRKDAVRGSRKLKNAILGMAA